MTDTPKDTTQSAETYTYGYDVHGSVSLLLKDTGEAKASYGYSAYGQLDDKMSAGDKAKQSDGDIEDPLNAYRYSAKRFDTGSQTIDMGARRFGPDFNRFLQVDQYMGALADLSLSTDPLTANRYSLAGGNPITFVETDGHMVVANGGGTAKESGGSGGGYTDGWAAGGGGSGSSSGGGGSSAGGGGPSAVDIAEDVVGVVKGAFEETGRAFGHLAYDAYACAQDRSACWDDVQQTTAYVSEHFFESVLAVGGAVKEEFERKKARGDTGEAIGGIVGVPGAVISKLRYLSKVSEVASSAASANRLSTHLRMLEKYGQGGFRELPDGRVRYYGQFKPADKEGPMAGARLVRQWDPETDSFRAWYETLDNEGRIRQVHPYQPASPYHYMFDENGNYGGRW